MPRHKCSARVATNRCRYQLMTLLTFVEIPGKPGFLFPSIRFLPKMLVTFVKAHH